MKIKENAEKPDFNALHATHEDLLKLVSELPTDYTPFGNDDRTENWSPDCSCGCRFFLVMEGNLGGDWGVCANPNSPRCGLLTFEHQGCREFETSGQINDWLENEREIQNQKPENQEFKERLLRRADERNISSVRRVVVSDN